MNTRFIADGEPKSKRLRHVMRLFFMKIDEVRRQDDWSRHRRTHLFTAKSGDYGVSTFFSSPEEARAWAAYAQDILTNKWRWQEARS
jgi:hypothetical protein